ncbi:MAG: anti-sigma factor domain-containing protein [Candidatus Dormibacteria bacterium]
MISCQDADVLAAALSVGSIDSGDQLALEAHLGSCAECRQVAGEYLAAAARLPLALEPLQPSPELRGRLMRAVYSGAEQARSPAPRAGPWWERLWASVPAARGFTVVAAAAAAAVIGVTSWSVASRSTAPSPVAVSLTATSAVPGAHGQLVYDRGSNQAVITVTGLPAPARIGGGTYEVWLVRPGGAAVAAAFLSREPDGSWGAAVHGDISKYAAVAATVEPAGGSPAPSGSRVVQATLTSS